MIDVTLKADARMAWLKVSSFVTTCQIAIAAVPATRNPANHCTWLFLSTRIGSPREATNNIANGKLPTIMNSVAIHSIPGLPKCPIEASAVEKPPVAIVVIEWVIASKPDIPTAQ